MFFETVKRDGTRNACRTSAVVLTKMKSHFNLRPFINREVRAIVGNTPHIFALEKKVLVVPAPLTILTKHIVRLRRRCSCDFCRTSPAPLLVFSGTSVKPS